MHAKREKMKNMYSKLSLLVVKKVNELLDLGVTFSGSIEIILSDIEANLNRGQLESMFYNRCLNSISAAGHAFVYSVVSCERSYASYENTLNFKVLINRG